MANVLKLVDKASDATVLFDFSNATGSGNPNSIKTTLMGDPDFGTIPQNAQFFEPEDSPGGTLTKSRHGLVQMAFKFRPEATTPDNLFAGIGKLGQYLDNPREYALLIQLEGWAEKRYADPVIGNILALLRGRERGLFETLTLLKDPQGIEVLLWRQPYLRGPSVTVGPTTVQNDPADASGRFIEVTNAGNAPAPAAFKVQGSGGSKIQEIVVARKSAGPFASTRVTDYTGGTQYGQLDASGNGWTVSLAPGTTSFADGAGSGGNVARTSHATDPTVMAKRIRITRTANMDSLRGTFDVYVRLYPASGDKTVQLRWSHSLADPATFSEVEVPLAGTNPSSYIDKKLGRISIPQGHTLGGLALEFWSRCAEAADDLYWDFVSLVPADESLSTILVPEGSTESWTGSQLVTAVSNPAGGTAGVVSGATLVLDTSTDNAGVPPNTGRALASGRHRWTYRMEGKDGQTVVTRIRNISGSTDKLAVTQTFVGDSVPTNYVIETDITDGNFYQEQVDDPSGSEGVIVYTVTHEFVPAILSVEEAHSDPERQMLHKMDSSDNILAPLSVEGPLPLWLQPGLNGIYIHYAEVPPAGSEAEPESLLTRDCPVTVTYSPRYLT